jgi:hypothetical protein
LYFSPTWTCRFGRVVARHSGTVIDERIGLSEVGMVEYLEELTTEFEILMLGNSS